MRFKFNPKTIEATRKQGLIYAVIGIAFIAVNLFSPESEVYPILIGVGIGQMSLGVFQYINSEYMKRNGFLQLKDNQIIRYSFITKKMNTADVIEWKDFAGDITFVDKNQKELSVAKDFLSEDALQSLYDYLEAASFPKRETQQM